MLENNASFQLQGELQTIELFIRHVPAAIAMLDNQMRYICVSDRWLEDYQLEEKNIIGRSHYEVFPELPERWKKDHQDCLTGKVEFLKNKEDSFVRLNGKVDWLRWELHSWKNMQGNIGGLLMFSEVITERKMLEQKLRADEAQMRSVFEAMSDLIFIFDLANNEIQLLPTRFINTRSKLVERRTIKSIRAWLSNSDESERYRDLMHQISITKQTFNFEHHVKIHNSYRWFSFNLAAISTTKIIWVGHDISQRKQVEQNLYAERELAQTTLSSIADGVITIDAAGLVKYINPAAERLTGWKTAEAQNSPLANIFQIVERHTREPIVNPVKLLLEKNRTSKLADNTLLLARNGTEYAVEYSTAPIHNRSRQLVGAIVIFHDVTRARNLIQQISWQATHDGLTGLYNRYQLEQQVRAAIQNARDNQTHHVLCYLDLDRFKIINDNCGHAAGDRLLQQITALFKQKIRRSDVFARLGGDEFGLLLYQCNINKAQEIAESLRKTVNDFRFIDRDKIFRIGVSIGLVAIDSTTSNLANLLNKADTACYAAKEKGRNCVYLSHSKDDRFSRQKGQSWWMGRINLALEKNLFQLYAQKIVSLKENDSNFHYELLLRLVGESGEIISPRVFLPTAERYDLMPAIDRWVVSTFLANYESYCNSRRKQGLAPLKNIYTINISGASISDREFNYFLDAQFEQHSIAPETICFEITETVAISNFDSAIHSIEHLKKLGCSIALDDFGSGMSSLAYLKNLPIDYLKIDGSFIKNLDENQLDYAMVECFHNISQVMNIKTIAEFVENDAILQNLKQIGIDYAQGYGIERPRPLTLSAPSYRKKQLS